MFAIITTDEYKDLLSAQHDAETYLFEFTKAVKELEELKVKSAKELEEVNANLKELLLTLVDGETKTGYGHTFYEWYDLLDRAEIAKYINENYVIDGKLQFEKVKEKADE